MKVLKTIAAWFGVAIVVFSIVLAIWNPTVDIPFTEIQTKAIVAEKIPLEIKKGNNTYTISEATVDFTDHGTVHVTGKVKAERKGSVALGDLDAEGIPVYNSADSAFYINNIQVHKLEITEVSLSEHHQEYVDAGKELIGAAKKKFGKFLSENQATKALIEKKKAEYREEAIKALKVFAVNQLASVPVYKFNKTDVTQAFASLALDKVTVTDDTMTVTLSVGYFIGRLWLYVIAFIAAIGVIFAAVQSGSIGGLLLLGMAS